MPTFCFKDDFGGDRYRQGIGGWQNIRSPSQAGRHQALCICLSVLKGSTCVYVAPVLVSFDINNLTERESVNLRRPPNYYQTVFHLQMYVAKLTKSV